jgi:hypothetical protein
MFKSWAANAALFICAVAMSYCTFALLVHA